MSTMSSGRRNEPARERAYQTHRKRVQRQSAARKVLRPPRAPKDPAAAVARWSKRVLRVPPGHPLAGKPLTLQAWQVGWLRGALSSRESLLSVARKNGKSALVAVVMLSHLHGPLRRPGWRGAVASLSGMKANELRMQIEQIAHASGLELTSRRSPYPGLVSTDWGSMDVLSADKDAGQAAGYDLICVDELGLFPERSRALMQGLRTSVSARDGKVMAISVRGDSDLLQEVLDRRDLDGTHVTIYAAEDGCKLDDEQSWSDANPGLDTIKSRSYMRDAVARALVTPADQSGFRAYDLNQRIDPQAQSIVSVTDWEACEVATESELPPQSGPAYVGIDLGTTDSLSAVVSIWPETKRMQSWVACPTVPDLVTRAQKDGAGMAYQTMLAEGTMRMMGYKVTDVSALIRWALGEIETEIVALGCDRHRITELEEALYHAECDITPEYRGTGGGVRPGGGAYDVRAFQRMVMNDQVRVQRLAGWALNMRNVVIRFTATGDPVLDKKKEGRRIDMIQAGVIASGMARQYYVPDAGPPMEIVLLHE